jgi:hypothetical protein
MYIGTRITRGKLIIYYVLYVAVCNECFLHVLSETGTKVSETCAK